MKVLQEKMYTCMVDDYNPINLIRGEKMDKYNLSDTAIGHVAQLLQLAILTGTDIIDHLRMAEFCINSDGNVDTHPDYSENFNESISRMMTEVQELAEATTGEAEGE